MVELDITDYLDENEGNIKIIKEWLQVNVGGLDLDWYLKFGQSAHESEGRGKGWQISFAIGKTFRAHRYPLTLLSWILKIEDDLVAVQFKMIWPESPVITSTVSS